MKNILFVSSEISGLVSTGGLAKASAEYCMALKEQGYNIILAMPKYGFINKKAENGEKIYYVDEFEFDTLELGKWTKIKFKIYITHIFFYKNDKKIKVPVYLLGNEKYFYEEDSDHMYSYINGSQNTVCEKFLLFCRGILEMIPILVGKGINIYPDIIHCNDWHVSPICSLLKDVYSKTSYYKNKNVSLVFTVHNSLYHGYCDVGRISIVSEYYKKYFLTKNIDYKGFILFLEIGLLYADYVTTVSPKYAEELCTKLYFNGQPTLLKLYNERRKSGEFAGILNGLITSEENDPIYLERIKAINQIEQYNKSIENLKMDMEQIKKELMELNKEKKDIRHLAYKQKRLTSQLETTIRYKNNLRLTEFNPSTYSTETLCLKDKNKLELQKALNLPIDAKIPIIVISGRLSHQKGVHILYRCIPRIIRDNKDIQIIIKGISTPGEKEIFEKPALTLEKKYRKNVRAILNFNKAEVLKLYGAGDILLIPSIYEPCGLVQMEAAKFGCVPVCSKTGGLEDSVMDYDYDVVDDNTISNRNQIIGYKFLFSLTHSDPSKEKQEKQLVIAQNNLIAAVNRAIHLYKCEREKWNEIVKINMTKDFSWDNSVQQYLNIYNHLYNKKQLELQEKANICKKNPSNNMFKIFYHRKFYSDHNYWGLVLYSKNNSHYKIINFENTVSINNKEYAVAKINICEIAQITDNYNYPLWIGIHKNGFNISKEEQRYLDFSSYTDLDIKNIYLSEHDHGIYFKPATSPKFSKDLNSNEHLQDNHNAPTKYNDTKYLKSFHKKYAYKKCDLGFSTYYDNMGKIQIALFKVWLPLAYKVDFLLYNLYSDEAPSAVYNMHMAEKGVWFIELPLSDIMDKFYTFKMNDKEEIIDIYAKACSVNAKKSAIINFEKTNPVGWNEHKRNFPHANNLSIYEMHVGDFTKHSTSDVDEANKGKFKGIIDKLEYLKQLGIDCIQLLPVTKFKSHETRVNSSSYKWGYDQIGCWFVIEGLYCTNPTDPYNRIIEFKELVQACHDAGIRVILDMAYTHVHNDRLFDHILPDYYFRQTHTGTKSSSLFGSELATNRYMVQKLIIDSLKYLAIEYCIDGFRFDFMTNIDLCTMKKIEKEMKKINKNFIIYGEANPTTTSALSPKMQSCWQNMHKFKQIGVFSNTSSAFPIRGINDMPGLCSNTSIDMNFYIYYEGSKGYMIIFDLDTFTTKIVNNKYTELINRMKQLNKKQDYLAFDYFIRKLENMGKRKCPQRLVHTIDTHDDLLLFDYLQMQNISYEEVIKRYKLAYSMLFGYQGSLLIKSGTEGLTTKNGSYNSYRVEELNLIDWERMRDNKDMQEFFISWIHFRKNHTKIFDGSGQINTVSFTSENDKFLKHILAKQINSRDILQSIIIIHNLSTMDEKLILPESISGKDWMILGNETGILEPEITYVIKKNEAFTIHALSTLVLKKL